MTGATREHTKKHGCMVMLVTIIEISNVGVFISQPDSHWGYHTEAVK
jgi:hypothetical protein